MKQYKVKLLTQSGIIEVIITEGDNLHKIEEETAKKYGKFITISTTLI